MGPHPNMLGCRWLWKLGATLASGLLKEND